MESYLKNIKADSSYSNSANTITESAQLCLEAIENDYNSLINEFNSAYIFQLFENTRLTSLEESDVMKSTKDSVSDFIIKSWAKNKGMYDIALAKIKSSTDAVKTSVKDRKTVSNIIKNIGSSDDKVYATTYSYGNLELVKKGVSSSNIARATQFLKMNIMKATPDNIEEIKKQFASMIGAADPSVKEIHKAVVGYLRTTPEKSFQIRKNQVEANIGEMWSVVYDFKKSSNELKKVFASSKADFDFLVKSSKNMKQENINRAQLSLYKYATEVFTVINSAILKTYQEERNIYKKVVFDSSRSVAKNMKKSMKESYNYFSEKESLFEW